MHGGILQRIGRQAAARGPSVSFCASQDLASCMEVGFLQQRTIIALREVIAPAGRVVAPKGCISRLVLPATLADMRLQKRRHDGIDIVHAIFHHSSRFCKLRHAHRICAIDHWTSCSVQSVQAVQAPRAGSAGRLRGKHE